MEKFFLKIWTYQKLLIIPSVIEFQLYVTEQKYTELNKGRFLDLVSNAKWERENQHVLFSTKTFVLGIKGPKCKFRIN